MVREATQRRQEFTLLPQQPLEPLEPLESFVAAAGAWMRRASVLPIASGSPRVSASASLAFVVQVPVKQVGWRMSRVETDDARACARSETAPTAEGQRNEANDDQ